MSIFNKKILLNLLPLVMVVFFFIPLAAYGQNVYCKCVDSLQREVKSCHSVTDASACEKEAETGTGGYLGISGVTTCTVYYDDKCTLLTPPPPKEKKPEYKYEPVYPTLQIPIPGVPGLTNFAKVEIKGPEGERYVYIPWISQYIAAIYGWAMGIVGILATVMILWGGIIYLTAGGIPERISTAKDYITSAIAGLLLAFGSYLLLYTINPSLVKFGAMKIAVVERVPLEVLEEEKGIETGISAGAEKTKCTSSITTYDEIFKKYAPCTGLDWQVLKGIACKESGFNADIVNKYGFTGLFQTKRCPEGEPMCDLKNPETNTKAVTPSLKRATNEIKKLCPNVSTKDFLILLYLAHNSGFGSLVGTSQVKGAIPRGGCQGDKLRQGMIEFWKEHSRVKGLKEPIDGEKRYNYAQKVADFITGPLGVKDPFGPTEGCPL
jgi:hypothetical protein